MLVVFPLGLLGAGPLIEHTSFPMTAMIYGGVGFLCTLPILWRWHAHLWPRSAPANGD